MRACEEMFGVDEGRRICGQIETATGEVCPCGRGDPCPITPAGAAPVLLTLRPTRRKCA